MKIRIQPKNLSNIAQRTAKPIYQDTYIGGTAVLIHKWKSRLGLYACHFLSLLLTHSLHAYIHLYIYTIIHIYMQSIHSLHSLLGYTLVADSNVVPRSSFFFLSFTAVGYFSSFLSLYSIVHSVRVSRARSKESGVGNLNGMLISFAFIVHAIHDHR